MAPRVTALERPAPARPALDAETVLAALPTPLFVLDAEDSLRFANMAAEQFFAASAAALIGRRLADILPADSPLIALAAQVRATGSSISEHGVTLETPRIGRHLVTIDCAPVPELPGSVVVSLQERSAARLFAQHHTQRGAARSLSAMAALLAHEIKNPLSGIRGAAQLLEGSLGEAEPELTRLICDEADRIVGLVGRMEMFAEERPIERRAVNIHLALGRVRRIAESGFARGVRFVEQYDPSLPPVYGHQDLLIQLFLNLVKNAAEAVPAEGGLITLTTRYQQGVRVTAPGSAGRAHLPLSVTVQDNGPGIPEAIRPHLFDPFVSTKAGGSGLGLALAAKIVADHGGAIEFSSEPPRTLFTVMLPVAPPGSAPA